MPRAVNRINTVHYDFFFFNRTELVEGLSVDVNFYPQPQSMSDQNVIPIFQTLLLYNLCD